MDTHPDWLTATLASDAAEARGMLPAWVHARSPEARIVGPAFAVLASEDDNLMLNQARKVPPPSGSVLVVGGQSTSRTATVGDITAMAIRNLCVNGLVTEGLVRDACGIREVGLAVWCRGMTPTASGERGPGANGGSVSLGGTAIFDGDWIIADEDGVVVRAKAEVETLFPRAAARMESDNPRIDAIPGAAAAVSR